MEVILKSRVTKTGEILIKHPLLKVADEIEVQLNIKQKTVPVKTYNFDDLKGKLSWKGDGLKYQKELRNEW